ncbi:class I SAM-dependent methyltransferase [Streptomyces sp. NPDC001393]
MTAACDRYFAVEALRSDTGHYTRTLAAWTKRLMRARDDVTALVGESTYRTFRTYLAAAELGFRHRHYTLYRLRLSRRTGVLNLAP